ncbi:MAG: nucleotidyltransferase domain-containing protein, partial [Candidatus Woesearchaeota archaeon]
FLNPVVYLFGSLSKAEAKIDSDFDLAIFTISKKELNTKEYEKKLKRKIQIFLYEYLESIQNKELKKNILNGFKLLGDW